MPPTPENDPHKLNRSLEDDAGQPTHPQQAAVNHQPEPSVPVPVMAPGSQPYINFLPRHHYAQLLGLLPGDLETFHHIIQLISEYEAVLDRSESLAASLGARLTGPRFLRGIERFFDGPIRVISPHPVVHSITWLDVVTFARANPDAFTPVILPDGARCRQFMYNGLQVEIAEDDWRLIYSGALDKFPLEHIFQEDEAAEMATLEIMLQRCSLLYKKADEVAVRARFLSCRLEARRKDVAHQLLRHADAPVANAVTVSSGFYAINHPPRSGPGSCGSPPHDLHGDLLHQFMVAAMQNQPPQGPPPGYYHHHHHQYPAFGSALPATIATGFGPLAPPPILEAPPYQPLPLLTYPNAAQPAGTTSSPSSSPSSLASILAPMPVLAPSPAASAPASAPASSTPAPVSLVSFPASSSLPVAPAPTPVPIPALPSRRARGRAARGRGRRGLAGKNSPPEKYRELVLKKINTVNKGDVIFPNCDRCRRLRLQCIKHLSACRGCTKKHARCSWRNVTDEEAEVVRHQLEIIEAEKAREEAEAAEAAAAAAAAGQAATGSANASNPGESSGAAADSASQVDLASSPASALALAAVAAAASSALASSSAFTFASSPSSSPSPPLSPSFSFASSSAESPLRLVPTSRLTRIDSAPPSVQRNPPRTGHLSAILSPPDDDDYEARAYHSA
ncbi:hypothetical protein HDV63DRAFT_151579 [Trichoderma sp. SZMC 28014]